MKQVPSQKPNPHKDFMRYSGMAFQLLSLILIGVWLGDMLDTKVGNVRPIWTAVCSLLAVLIGLYQLLREALRP